MEAKELNRAIVRLNRLIHHQSASLAMTDYFKWIETDAKKEFLRLYHADDTFEYMNMTSMKILLRLNIRHRFVPLFHFGNKIEL